jgi:hypothetical protein
MRSKPFCFADEPPKKGRHHAALFLRTVSPENSVIPFSFRVSKAAGSSAESVQNACFLVAQPI